MTSLAACAAAFFLVLLVGRRSRVAGLSVLLAVGYAYGIVRANLGEPAAYFLFDAALGGFYLSLISLEWPVSERDSTVWKWFVVLTIWPIVMFAVPFEDPLVQLVGLRGSVFLLPMIVLAARLRDDEYDTLALIVALLNWAALAVAVAEFRFGVDTFVPENELTTIIYQSQDVADFTEFRIPATFTSAHAYAGTMAATLPLLIWAWTRRAPLHWFRRGLLSSALLVSILGVLLSATRLSAIVAGTIVVAATFSGQLRALAWIGWIIGLAAVGWVVNSEERLQRFLTLRDSEFIVERVRGSVNLQFFDLLDEYPFGSGLGTGGTSIPAFLLDRLITRIAGLENEYSRILLEQGAVGVVLWLAFIVWIGWRFVHLAHGVRGERFVAFVCVGAVFATGLLGIGLLSSIPATCLLFLMIGFVVRLPSAQSSDPARSVPPRLRTTTLGRRGANRAPRHVGT